MVECEVIKYNPADKVKMQKEDLDWIDIVVKGENANEGHITYRQAMVNFCMK